MRLYNKAVFMKRNDLWSSSLNISETQTIEVFILWHIPMTNTHARHLFLSLLTTCQLSCTPSPHNHPHTLHCCLGGGKAVLASHCLLWLGGFNAVEIIGEIFQRLLWSYDSSIETWMYAPRANKSAECAIILQFQWEHTNIIRGRFFKSDNDILQIS